MADQKFSTAELSTPITEFLASGGNATKLTANAAKLVEADLVALAWRNNTARTQNLTWRDIVSIEDAFQDHPFRGDAQSELVGAACCCTCTPACCCTAAATVNA
jgi:hypothetical protein